MSRKPNPGNQHVVHLSGKSWGVKSEGSSLPSSVHNKQSEAIERGRSNAKYYSSELFIHGRDGRIRERNTYGRDPFPPRG
jgi:hypothetical protein